MGTLQSLGMAYGCHARLRLWERVFAAPHYPFLFMTSLMHMVVESRPPFLTFLVSSYAQVTFLKEETDFETILVSNTCGITILAWDVLYLSLSLSLSLIHVS